MAITERFKSGALRCLVNVNTLTTGFNARCVDLLAFLRPTHSSNLYVQMAGRGMRLSPETGKIDCMVLDFAGLIDKHGAVNDVTPPAKKGDGNGEAPIKECDQCYMLVPAGASTCQFCGFEFPPPESGSNINETASHTDIIKKAGLGSKAKPTRHEITVVHYSVHDKPGKISSMKVSYLSGFRVVATEWVCLFHPGRAGSKGKSWWNENVGGLYTPGDILQAVEFAEKYAREINYIYTEIDGRYDRVISRGYEEVES